MILRRPPRDAEVEVLDDHDVEERVRAGRLVRLDGETPVSRTRVAALRKWMRQRDAERRAKRTGKERSR